MGSQTSRSYIRHPHSGVPMYPAGMATNVAEAHMHSLGYGDQLAANQDSASGSRDPKEDDEDSLDLIPIMFRWTGGGHRVFVTGTFNDWTDKIPMLRSGQEFFQLLQIPRGEHQYKFIVDDEWKFGVDQQIAHDANGNVNNHLDVSNYQKYSPDDVVQWDPLDVDEAEFDQQDIPNPQQADPPAVATLLLRSPALAVPPKRVDSIAVLERGRADKTRSVPHVPLHSACMHPFHDGATTCKTYGGSVMLTSVNMRYKSKFSCTLLMSPSKVEKDKSPLIERTVKDHSVEASCPIEIMMSFARRDTMKRLKARNPMSMVIKRPPHHSEVASQSRGLGDSRNSSCWFLKAASNPELPQFSPPRREKEEN